MPNGTTVLVPETRPVGAIIYNKDYDVIQFCGNDETWYALGPFEAGNACAPAVIQSMWASRGNTGTLQKALTADAGAGNGILVFAALMGSTIPDHGVTDNQGNNYTKLYTGPSSDGTRQYLFSAGNINGGPLTITVSPSSSGGAGVSWAAIELESTDVTNFDVSAHQSASNGHVNFSAGPTTETDEIAFVFIDVDTNHSANITPPSGWTHEINKDEGSLPAYSGDAVLSLSHSAVPNPGIVDFNINFSTPAWEGRASLFTFGPACD